MVLKPKPNLVILGASTGGPGHLGKIIPVLTSKTEVYVVLQHMTSYCFESFVSHLANIGQLPVFTAQPNMQLIPGHIYVIIDNTLGLSCDTATHTPYFRKTSRYYPHTPSIDGFLETLCEHLNCFAKTRLFILTGIGSDGTQFCECLSRQGVELFAESEISAIVHGMPRSIAEKCKNTRILTLNEIKNLLSNDE